MPYIGRGPQQSGAFRILDDVSGGFNGVLTSFALTVGSAALTVGLPETLLIAVDGVIQEAGSAYTISGSNIVFTAAPQADATFWGVELGDVGGLADRATTQSANDNTTNIATTAYVQTELGDYAPLANPTLTGTPAGPTANANTNTTQLATTAYVQTELTAYATDTVTLTNKTFDADATGNNLTNIEVANLKSGVLDIDLTDAAGTDTTLASAKAIKTQLDLKATLASAVFTTSIRITPQTSAPGSQSSATAGTIYFDTEDKVAYIWEGSAWMPLNVKASVNATGGTINNSVSGYRIHIFTSGSTTFTPANAGNVDYLIVAGGGQGGGRVGGGGGAGGVLTAGGLAVLAQDYTIVVGAGGSTSTGNATGQNGVNSTMSGSGFTTLTAIGGGGGAYTAGSGATGGSGGGGNETSHPNYGSGTSGQGNDGGNGGVYNGTNAAGGGGGGFGAVGGAAASASTGGVGGAGHNIIMGLSAANSTLVLATVPVGEVDGGTRYIAAGGGGGTYGNSTTVGVGGLGGGGDAGAADQAGSAGIANTGSGGGGGTTTGVPHPNGGAGGSGIVIIRYAV